MRHRGFRDRDFVEILLFLTTLYFIERIFRVFKYSTQRKRGKLLLPGEDRSKRHRVIDVIFSFLAIIFLLIISSWYRSC